MTPGRAAPGGRDHEVEVVDVTRELLQALQGTRFSRAQQALSSKLQAPSCKQFPVGRLLADAFELNLQRARKSVLAYRLLPLAYSLLPTAYCLAPFAYCAVWIAAAGASSAMTARGNRTPVGGSDRIRNFMSAYEVEFELRKQSANRLPTGSGQCRDDPRRSSGV